MIAVCAGLSVIACTQTVSSETRINSDVAYGSTTLPIGVRSQLVENGNGCQMHILEAGFEGDDKPLIILLHGFPELAYSWRHQLIPLANAGYHVVAPDLRGFGRSCGTDVKYSDDLKPYATLNHVADMIGLVYALGYDKAEAIVGHDFGSAVAANAALHRPDLFGALVLVSVPYTGPNSITKGDGGSEHRPSMALANLPNALASMSPPQTHYWWYYSKEQANEELLTAPDGLSAFFRSYFYAKSGYPGAPKPSAPISMSPESLAELPNYYVLDTSETMVDAVADYMPGEPFSEHMPWLNEAELSVYASEYERSGFQGGLQLYRLIIDPSYSYGLSTFTDEKVLVPSLFITGESDWAPYLIPNSLDMMSNALPALQGSHFITNSGHMVQQETPEEFNDILLHFLDRLNTKEP